MNGNHEKDQDAYRSFLLLSEIEKEEALSQRDMAQRVGIALGLVNSYLKNLVAKGFVRVKTFPRNRYSYLLTPKGMAEKGRLAYQHLNYFTSLYTATRQDYLSLFRTLQAQGIREVAFCGVDEVAEIAYLSLQEAGMELAEVMDDEQHCNSFFDRPVLSLAQGSMGDGPIVITSLKKRGALHRELLRLGVAPGNIRAVAEAGGV